MAATRRALILAIVEAPDVTDPIFSPRLVIKLDKSTPAWAATFDFVLDIA